ncbi:ATP synthase F0F1 subunit B' [Rhizobium sp. Leaf306]|uniref:F0F1 ATP synthase subunit B n=2 Tax=unclassified Rhizobium TaxID=2613769 RepID=UPI000712C777|nr:MULTISPECIES: F0F1 ATP synthase subunit B [unclassified Rhizobium]KQQ38073.1 ATP synthase F0F1 subunit B' [Rhizobium sp. Leaf306]MBD8649550.1 F0F1 ATP synthase subunit B [Rhizobium sp. CFBP 13726]
MMFVTSAYAQTAPAAPETPAAPGAAPAAEPHAAPAGEVHTETGVAHDTEHSGAFPPLDSSHFASQLLWLVITFGLFYLLMKNVIVPRVGGIIEDRHDRIAKDLEEAGRAKAEADAAVETYEKELAAARAKSHGIAEAAREAAKTKAAADRSAIEAELAAKLSAAETRIGEIKDKAFAEVGQIAEETASAIVDLMIGGKASGDDIKAAVAAAKTGA